MNEAKVVRAMAALSNGTRFEIFRLLASESPGGLSPSAIAERLAIGPSVASYHLFKLIRSGLATRERKGNRVIYSAEPAAAQACASLVGNLGTMVAVPPAD